MKRRSFIQFCDAIHVTSAREARVHVCSVAKLCEALGLSSWFYAWLTVARSRHSPGNEAVNHQTRLSFVDSDHVYSARRVWREWEPAIYADCIASSD